MEGIFGRSWFVFPRSAATRRGADIILRGKGESARRDSAQRASPAAISRFGGSGRGCGGALRHRHPRLRTDRRTE